MRVSTIHAATTFSDFVCGIEPALQSGEVGFHRKEGALLVAIRMAKEHPQKNVLLIIDEINRANLANVLGPVFYLFEPSEVGQSAGFKVEIGDEELEAMPNNLYVLATMNTADRSIAVVDFALRRRFAWYTIPALPIKADNKHTFYEPQFNEIDAIFKKYATDQELNLQPGPSYFLTDETGKKADDKKDADVSDTFKDKLRYELMPLLKEYFEEGYLLPAKDAVVSFFLKFGIQVYN